MKSGNLSSAIINFSRYTKIVADTADIESIKKYQPLDATTNPSLILKTLENSKGEEDVAERMNQMKEEVEKIIGQKKSDDFSNDDEVYCVTAVWLGSEILKIISGRISTEVPACYSFDKEATINLARYIIRLYENRGIGRERILIKIASTWEGIQAASVLEKEGIHCNMTLLFSLTQAIACAEAGVKLISPFVGRVYDWYKEKETRDFIGENDPGVKLVTTIFNYYKKFGYTVEIMGASFRNLSQIMALLGCDLLTISPNLLSELEGYSGKIEPRLNALNAKESDMCKRSIDHKTFLWEMNEDGMATEKLSEGIRLFHRDFMELNQLLNK